jgi:hypothetical protein
MSDYDGFGRNDDDDYVDTDLDEVLFGRAADSHAVDLMWNAVQAGEHSVAWTDFAEYLWDFYGIDVTAEWDWADFKTWYDTQ